MAPSAASGHAPHGRRRAVAVAAVIAVAAAILVVLVGRTRGYAATSVSPDPQSVWVTNDAEFMVGRVNMQIDELESAAMLDGGHYDVLQDGRHVVVVDTTNHRLRTLNVATVTLGPPIRIPDEASVALGGTRISVADRATGAVWTSPLGDLGPDTLTGSDPAFVSGAGVTLAASRDGTVAAVAPGSRTVLTLAPGSAVPRQLRLAHRVSGSDRVSSDGDNADGHGGTTRPATSTSVSLTMVGDTPVVLDTTAGRLLTPRRSIALPRGSTDAVLQQPGAASGAVLVATSTALLRIPLDGRVVQRFDAGVTGAPAAPVWMGGCADAAWAGEHPTYLRWCGSVPSVRPIPRAASSARLVFRVNGDTVVLNDVATGNVWVADKDMTLIDNWDQVAPQRQNAVDDTHQKDDADASELTLSRTDCSGGMSPPSAADDDFGIRAGRPTVLPVMGNDSVSDCSVTTIAAVTALPADVGTVRIVDHRTALQVITDADATGTLAPLTYRLSDGDGHTARAAVAIRIVPAHTHHPPTKLRDSATVLALGGVTTTDVLTDWISPDGDPLFLTSARIDNPSETVSFTPDGSITVRDPGTGTPGKHTVDFTVSDGTDTQQGTLTVQAVATADLVPVPSPVYARTPADVPVTVHPLDGVLSIGPDPLRLTAVTPATGTPRSAGLSAVPDLDTGAVVIGADRPGAYYLTFQVASGSQTAKGVIRVDVTAPSDDPTPIPVVDTAYLPQGGTVRVDLVANDIDPADDVLAVQQVSLPDGSPMVVTVVDKHIAAISARVALPPAGEWFSYTVAGTGPPSTGWVHVVGVPPSSADTPIATPISMTVRAGDAVTVDASTAARDPSGSPLTVQPFHALPDGSGLLFASGDRIRYLAPPAGAAPPIATTYTVTNTRGRSDTSSLQIRVVPVGVNHPPRTPAVATARAFTGQTVPIGLPLDGIDPDGDWATVTAISQQPDRGTAAVAGPGTITVTAPDSPGVVTVGYTVTDPSGAHSTGTVMVGVIDPPDVVQPPVAPNLTATVAPRHSLAVDVLDSVTDPSGLPVDFADPGIAVPASAGVTAHIGGGSVVLTAGPRATVVPLTYTVQNAAGLTASGSITVTVSPDAPAVPPVAQDAYVTPAMVSPDGRSALVDVSGLVSNPGGLPGDLRLRIPPVDRHAASKAGRLTVRVALTGRRQVLAYQVDNAAHLTASAFIVVPSRHEIVPHSKPSGGTAGTATSSPPTAPATSAPTASSRRATRSTAPSTTPASPTPRTSTARPPATATTRRPTGTRTTTGATSRTATTTGATGTATSRSTRTTPTRTSSTPAPPAPRVSALHVSLEAGGSRTVHLTGMVRDAGRYQHLTFSGPRGGGHGISGTLNGSVLTVSASIGAPDGTSADLAVTVSDGVHRPVTGHVQVSVTATTAPAPTVPDRSTTTDQGSPVTANMLAGATNPLASKGPLRVVSATLTSGQATVSHTGDGQVTVTPAATETGTVSVLVTAMDPARRRTSGTLTVTVLGLPDPPAAVSVSGTGDGSATLTWRAPDDHGSPITHYLVSASGVNVDCGTRTSCTVRGLHNGQSYVFTVRARNGVGDSAPSAPTAPVTPDVAPGAPGKPAVTAGDQQLEVAWTAPQNHGSPIDHYTVTITPAPAGGPATLSSTTTHVVFAHLVNGRAYTVTVTAINATGTHGPASAPSDPATPAARPAAPSQPDLSFQQSGGHNTIDVTWSAPSDDGGDPNLTYTVVWTSSDGGSGSVDAKTDRSATIDDVTLGTQYTVRVVAANKAGSSEPGPSATITPATVPGQVTGLTASAIGDGTVALSWTAPPDNGRTITGYRYSTGDGWTSTGSGTTTSATIDGLTTGQSYSFSVQACNGDSACGARSAAATANPYSAPGAVRALNAYGTGTSSNIKATWTAPASDGGRDITGYQYRTAPYGGSYSAWKQSPNGTGTSFTISGFRDGTNYWVQVRAVNATATGDAGATTTHHGDTEKDGATPCRPPDRMAAPTGSNITTSSITLHWRKPFNGGRAISKFQYRKHRSGVAYGAWHDAGSGTSHTVTGLRAGTTYRFEVRACNSVACGSASPSSGITTTKPTPKPTLKLVHGPVRSGCNSTCYYLGIKYTHVKSGTYRVCFHFNRETDSWCWRSYSVHLSGSGRWNTKMYGDNYGYYGFHSRGKARLYKGGKVYVTSPARTW